MRKDWLYLKTDEEVKIAWDTYRLKILSVFRLSDEPLTVKQVADQMGEVPAKIHYHVQKLLSIDMLELVKTKVVNGIVAKYYTNKYAGSDIASEGVSDDVVIRYARHAHYDNLNRSLAKFRDSMHLTDQVMNARDDVRLVDSVCVFFKMHMTEEERDAFEQLILTHARKYKDAREGTREYGVLAGVTRRT